MLSENGPHLELEWALDPTTENKAVKADTEDIYLHCPCESRVATKKYAVIVNSRSMSQASASCKEQLTNLKRNSQELIQYHFENHCFLQMQF